MSLTNLDGKPGETIKVSITLTGTDTEERIGFWYTNYKKTDGDDNKMDITSWVTIEPKDYTINNGEKKDFTVTVKVPRNAQEGLWGAISKDAGLEGHASERRTYIVFKDAPGGGNVYSGLLLPVSVRVSALTEGGAVVSNFIMKNLLVIGLVAVIIIMVGVQIILKIKKSKKRRPL